jgi:subtilase family serine protease
MGPRRRLAALVTGGLALIIAACSSGSGSRPAGSGSGGTAGTPAASHVGSPAASPGGGPASPAQHLPGPPLPSGMTALTPAQLRRAYDVDPLLRRGVDGRGQTIVIVDPFGSPSIAHDLAYFDQEFGLPAPPSLKVIQPTGPVPPYRPTPNRATAAAETTLDVEAAHVMAPGASLLVVETNKVELEGRTGFPQIVAAEKYVIRHHLGGVISQSFGATEQTFASAAGLRSLRGSFLLAARPAYRVTVLAATGDTGAAGYTYSMAGVFPSPAVSWPASDPLVTAVGGTELNLSPAGRRRSQDVAWPQGGGGRSSVFARPAYQQGLPGVTAAHRVIPDIAMDGSCESGMAAFGVGQSALPKPGWFVACGTSLSTPLLAGLVALAGQQAGHSLGLINPALYRMAAAHDRGIVDVRRGDNSYPLSGSPSVHGFTAGPGYDLTTGVGTVDAAYFVPDLARLAG